MRFIHAPQSANAPAVGLSKIIPVFISLCTPHAWRRSHTRCMNTVGGGDTAQNVAWRGLLHAVRGRLQKPSAGGERNSQALMLCGRCTRAQTETESEPVLIRTGAQVHTGQCAMCVPVHSSFRAEREALRERRACGARAHASACVCASPPGARARGALAGGVDRDDDIGVREHRRALDRAVDPRPRRVEPHDVEVRAQELEASAHKLNEEAHLKTRGRAELLTMSNHARACALHRLAQEREQECRLQQRPRM
eukprot:6214509-Pleurochrysis_carterae.AAC.3